MKTKNTLLITLMSVVLMTNCNTTSNETSAMNQTETTAPDQSKSITATILVSTSGPETFDDIKIFRCWWSENVEGNTDRLYETFFYHYQDIHLCTLKHI